MRSKKWYPQRQRPPAHLLTFAEFDCPVRIDKKLELFAVTFQPGDDRLIEGYHPDSHHLLLEFLHVRRNLFLAHFHECRLFY